MQIAYSNDRKKQLKSHLDLEENAVIFCHGDLEENTDSNPYLRYRNLPEQSIFEIPDSYLLNKFVGDFLKSDGVKFLFN